MLSMLLWVGTGQVHEHLTRVLLVFGRHLYLVEDAAACLVDHHVLLGRARTTLVEDVRSGHLLHVHRLRVLRVSRRHDVLRELLARELAPKTFLVFVLPPAGALEVHLKRLLGRTQPLLCLALIARRRLLGLLLGRV